MKSPEQYLFPDDGVFPNSRLPALIYRGALTGDLRDRAGAFETMFAHNGWTGAWRNGLYTFHHYHSTAHEVLGVCVGHVEVALGGPGGKIVRARAGDVLVVPAGLAHKNVDQSEDLRVVGAYPRGTTYDMMYGKPGERPEADHNLGRLPQPASDPVFGPGGPLTSLWRAVKSSPESRRPRR